MELKKFQDDVLGQLDKYLSELSKALEGSYKFQQFIDENPDAGYELPDFTVKAWEAMDKAKLLPPARQNRDYSPRQDNAGNHVPNICLKIPTGGGKTFLAVSAVSKVFTNYYRRHTGVVLWVVPNEAIYTQTKQALTNRNHPYRQLLDKIGAYRVKILEKNSPLHQADVEEHLCVFLLMLQSANRRTKETLRLFRDRGNVLGFIPPEDDYEGHINLLEAVPNLDTYGDGKSLGSIVQSSLGNVLRLVRPMVVMDEGHRAYTRSALDTLYGFNPSFMLELSATPKDRDKETPPQHSNWLVDVRGKELEEAELIKLPINVEVNPASGQWQDTLRASVEKLNELQQQADDLQIKNGRYIRPILLVQVQRTGTDQRETGFIHAEDVADYLQQLGYQDNQIAIKSAEKNDLKQPENLDLLSPESSVRFIITKQALQEGWDCPFAYVLCALAAGSNMGAMTQLSGRILRQPHATKTGYAPLDECYIYCQHETTGAVVKAIKKGLEDDGMGDLALSIKEPNSVDGSSATQQTKQVKRRSAFKNLEIFLPRVLWVENETVRPLDYEQDILYRLDWSAISIEETAKEMPVSVQEAHPQRIKVYSDLSYSREATKKAQTGDRNTRFDPVYVVRALSDLVPNAWQAWDYASQLAEQLRGRGFTEKQLVAITSHMIEELRKTISSERDRMAEQTFLQYVNSGNIQFKLRTDTHNWKMPHAYTIPDETNREMWCDNTAKTAEKSLFPVYEGELNKLEVEFACYLENDQHNVLKWWHRNVAKSDYALQGWKKHRVYPDFIFALRKDNQQQQIVVMETKGLHLEGNQDTAYKQRLLNALSDAYQQGSLQTQGTLELDDQGTQVICDLVFEDDWKNKLETKYLHNNSETANRTV